MTMNGNLSTTQFSSNQSSMTKMGAMPIKDKFDGAAPLKESGNQNRMSPNASAPLPKPGFF